MDRARATRSSSERFSRRSAPSRTLAMASSRVRADDGSGLAGPDGAEIVVIVVVSAVIVHVLLMTSTHP
jgi:hypothetical protein